MANSKVGLTTNAITGVLPAANGGTGNVNGTPSGAVNLAASGAGGVTGNLPVANLNGGTSASSSTFWRGDGAWVAPGGVSLSGSTNNQVTTVSGANALVGEVGLTYDGSTLTTINSDIFIQGTNDAVRSLRFDADRNAQDEELGIIGFYWGAKPNPVAQIRALAGSDTNNEDAGKIEFQTTAEAANGLTTRMHIAQNGTINIAGATGRAATLQVVDNLSGTGYEALSLKCDSSNNCTQISFVNSNGTVGYINTSGTATSYLTSSDYRLKENVSYEFDATTRLKQLKPARFNFIADADTTVDGFIAHEVSSIIPEAITGEKDALEKYRNADETPEGSEIGDNKLDENGDTMIDAQSIDQSKLVPLLVKTIQELEARITTLENA
jgi:hypothetical protein